LLARLAEQDGNGLTESVTGSTAKSTSNRLPQLPAQCGQAATQPLEMADQGAAGRTEQIAQT
jgi:hypothetical protein